MVVFETRSGARYEWHGTSLLRLDVDRLEVRTDVREIGRLVVGQRAVLMTWDGRFSLTDRLTALERIA